jgi:ferritin-like metal-binding protein YciE
MLDCLGDRFWVVRVRAPDLAPLGWRRELAPLLEPDARVPRLVLAVLARPLSFRDAALPELDARVRPLVFAVLARLLDASLPELDVVRLRVLVASSAGLDDARVFAWLFVRVFRCAVAMPHSLLEDPSRQRYPRGAVCNRATTRFRTSGTGTTAQTGATFGRVKMPETTVRDSKMIDLLNDAYSKEKELEAALQSHLEMTVRSDYQKRLKEHVRETKSHATAVAKRITQLGGEPAIVSMPGPEGLSRAAQGVHDVVGKAKAAAQGPLDAVRGSGEQARMLHNARAEFENEAHEIATYTVIDSFAKAVGDRPTAELARKILRDEERMQAFLGKLLADLSIDMAHDEVPVSEIHGEAARRVSTAPKARRPVRSS